MGKVKNAAIAAQKTADIMRANESLLWRARAVLSKALDDPEPFEGMASAETALHLINTYLMESELCKR
jgi:hypothetical protein